MSETEKTNSLEKAVKKTPAKTAKRAAKPKAVAKEVSVEERAAKACHEVNRAYCEGHGDFSQKPWDQVSAETKKSALAGIEAVKENPSIRPQDLHDKWCSFKLENGWKFGEKKDEKEKTHPCLVSYRELPEQQKAKDSLFMITAKSILFA